MVDKLMRQLIDAYNQMASPTQFFTGMFNITSKSFHNTETVEVDVSRRDEDIAIVVQDMSTGYRFSTLDRFTNKEFRPPVYKEATTLNVYDLFGRDAGQNPFEDFTFQGKAVARAFEAFLVLEERIRRAVELQAAQVLQTAKADLKDSASNSLYQIDYKGKASHFVNAGTAWSDTANCDPFADLEALGKQIRKDGLVSPDRIIFGSTSWKEFNDSTKVKAVLNRDLKIDVGAIARMERNSNGGTYHGSLDIGRYTYELWTYDGEYVDPTTPGNKIEYLGLEKVIMMASKGRRDLSFGAVPRIVPPDSRVLPFLPSRVSSNGGRRDLFMNAWVDAAGENLSAGVASRPLCIPVAIDTFGCLST